ncbi:MAG TPA: class I SAM-dependent methyltransferase [Sandaracinaceae bacterium LLY-WYZ-13_1]|nr:class I SAM-dependent methyltransferase [Sandaracinaceae bacterium LLY-WYZ-13_1]
MDAPDGPDARAIEDHYDRYPYPEGDTLEVPTPPAHVAGTLSFLARRRAADALSTRPRIWVAGCGTLQAATVGLTFPEAEVLATDVSTRTLERAAARAEAAGARQVRFERRDLRDPPGPARFDLVICTGVVHHLADPARGLAHVRAALAPNGLLQLMVYNRAHRSVLAPLRRATRRLGVPDEDPLTTAGRVLEAALGPRCRSPDRELLESLRDLRTRHRAFVADILLNPCEHDYDVDGMLALLDAAGLRFAAWRHPGEWRLSSVLQDPVLRARAAALDPMDEARAVHEIAGLASPMLDVIAERDDAPARPPYDDDEWAAMRLVRSRGERELTLGPDRPPRERRIPPYRVERGTVGGTIRGGHGAPRVWAVPEAARPVLEACDGETSVAALEARFADEASRDDLRAMLRTLSPLDVGLLAPVWKPIEPTR